MRHNSHFDLRHARIALGGILIASLAACASGSAGDLPHLQETLAARCAPSSIKQCHVSGGNKFNKRYDYCECIAGY